MNEGWFTFHARAGVLSALLVLTSDLFGHAVVVPGEVEGGEKGAGVATGTTILEWQLSRVAYSTRGQAVRDVAAPASRLLHKPLHRVEQMDLVATTAQPECVEPSGTADVQHGRGRRRQMATQQPTGTLGLKLRRPASQPILFVSLLVVAADVRVQAHSEGSVTARRDPAAPVLYDTRPFVGRLDTNHLAPTL